MTNRFDKLSDKPVCPVLIVNGENTIEINGGRTRARTWDPLIKSQATDAVFAQEFHKLIRKHGA